VTGQPTTGNRDTESIATAPPRSLGLKETAGATGRRKIGFHDFEEVVKDCWWEPT
jgi:hypothetical protein